MFRPLEGETRSSRALPLELWPRTIVLDGHVSVQAPQVDEGFLISASSFPHLGTLHVVANSMTTHSPRTSFLALPKTSLLLAALLPGLATSYAGEALSRN